MRRPESVVTLLAGFEGTDSAGEAVSAIIAAGILPSAIEMMDTLALEAVELAVHPNYPKAAAVLIVELDGVAAEVEQCLAAVRSICLEHGGGSLRVAADEAERALLWKGRKAAFAAAGRLSPGFYVQDGVVPRTALPGVLARIAELSSQSGIRIANVFHAGDGNLHPLVLYDPAVPGEAERAGEVGAEILHICLEHGGSITGEHGVGLDKKRYLPEMFAPADLEAMYRLRCAFDPDHRANPGKLFPTPRLCGEVPGPYTEHPLERAGVAARW
jgi:glycolate oxidase